MQSMHTGGVNKFTLGLLSLLKLCFCGWGFGEMVPLTCAVTVFPHGCDQESSRKQLKRKGLILAHSVRRRLQRRRCPGDSQLHAAGAWVSKDQEVS